MMMMMMKKTLVYRKSIPNGPFRSRLEKNVHSIICKNIIDKKAIKIEINKRGLVPRNKRLELDLYFPRYNLGIEIQGPIHHGEAKNILNDYWKMQYFRDVGINILYIYTNSTEQMNRCIDRCVAIVKKKIINNNNDL